jgi:hypothetical protein
MSWRASKAQSRIPVPEELIPSQLSIAKFAAGGVTAVKRDVGMTTPLSWQVSISRLQIEELARREIKTMAGLATLPLPLQ